MDDHTTTPIPADYRIMRDGNGTHWIEREVTRRLIWGRGRKVWRPLLEGVYHRDGYEGRVRKTFLTKEDACAWLRKRLQQAERNRLHAERAKQRINCGPC